MSKSKGIFCLEGEWSRNLLQTSSVEPILSLLSQWEPHFVPYVHRQVTSSSSIRDYLSQWVLRRYDAFPILYLAFHGHPGVVCLDERCEAASELSMEGLEQILAGKCRGRIIYFGSCGTLQTHGNRLPASRQSAGTCRHHQLDHHQGNISPSNTGRYHHTGSAWSKLSRRRPAVWVNNTASR